MLKYREFLEQSRAQRGYKPSYLHYEGPEKPFVKSSQNIKQFVSQPNYGQIFYSDQQGQKVPKINLKQSLQNQKAKGKQFGSYLKHLEQQNILLRAKLTQLVHLLKSNKSFDENMQQTFFSQMRPSSPQAAQRQQITPSMPSQQQIPLPNPDYNKQRLNGPYIDQSQPLPQPQQQAQVYIPQYSNKLAQFYQSNPQQQHRYEPQYIQQQQMEQQQDYQAQPENIPQSQPYAAQPQSPIQSQAYPFPQMLSSLGQIPYRETITIENKNPYNPYQNSHPIPTIQNPAQNPTLGSNSVLDIARRKLAQIKDNDEELRQYTIQLMRKNR